MSTAKALLKTGAPRKFTDPVAFQTTIDAYFARCDAEDTPYTMHGLARALDCNRLTLLNYEGYVDAEPFISSIKHARERVAEWTEVRLHTKGFHPAGAIFSLKNNFGWQDVQDVRVNIEMLVGVQTTDEQRRGLLPIVDMRALSPAPETLTALSPGSEIPVSADVSEAKATPIEGVSPHSVA